MVLVVGSLGAVHRGYCWSNMTSGRGRHKNSHLVSAEMRAGGFVVSIGSLLMSIEDHFRKVWRMKLRYGDCSLNSIQSVIAWFLRRRDPYREKSHEMMMLMMR